VVGRVDDLDYQECAPLIYGGRSFGTHNRFNTDIRSHHR
jgi:hypothetical protein